MSEKVVSKKNKVVKKYDTENLNYAGFWIRVLANIIDFMIVLPIIIYLLTGESVYYGGNNVYDIHYMNGHLILSIVYVIAFWIWNGATPGKLLLKLKIINIDGTFINWKTALLRNITYLASALPFLFGFFSIGIDSHKQGWHDKISKTYVIKISSK